MTGPKCVFICTMQKRIKTSFSSTLCKEFDWVGIKLIAFFFILIESFKREDMRRTSGNQVDKPDLFPFLAFEAHIIKKFPDHIQFEFRKKVKLCLKSRDLIG